MIHTLKGTFMNRALRLQLNQVLKLEISIIEQPLNPQTETN